MNFEFRNSDFGFREPALAAGGCPASSIRSRCLASTCAACRDGMRRNSKSEIRNPKSGTATDEQVSTGLPARGSGPAAGVGDAAGGALSPEYREVRKRAGDFLTMCYTPEIAAEVTLQPIRRFGLDAAIVFSDILTPLVPMGAGLDVHAIPPHRQPGSRAC